MLRHRVISFSFLFNIFLLLLQPFSLTQHILLIWNSQDRVNHYYPSIHLFKFYKNLPFFYRIQPFQVIFSTDLFYLALIHKFLLSISFFLLLNFEFPTHFLLPLPPPLLLPFPNFQLVVEINSFYLDYFQDPIRSILSFRMKQPHAILYIN